jgi:hypothetical protein
MERIGGQYFLTATSTILLILATSASAIEFSAFGSVVVGRINIEENIRLIDYDDDWSTTSESLLGVQLNHIISSDLSFTAQVIAEGFSYRDREEYDPRFDWAFLSYRFSHAYSARLGRIRTPLFFYSDSIHVGYSYSWVRPPVDVYNPKISGATVNIDGFDMTFNHQFNMSDLEASFYIGQGEGRNNDFIATVDFVTGISLAWFDYDTTLRYSMVAAKGDLQEKRLNTVGNTFQQLVDFFNVPPIFQQIADGHYIENGWLYYFSLGVERNAGDWILRSEINYQTENADSIATRYKGIYSSVSRTFGQLTPYAVAGYGKIQVNNYLQDLIYESQQILPQGIFPPMDTLRQAALAGYEAINTDGWSVTLGCRYDFHPKAALNIEFQHLDSFRHPAFDRQISVLIDRTSQSVLATTIGLDFIL